MALHQQQLSGDDSQMGILLKASARIARCMKVPPTHTHTHTHTLTYTHTHKR